MVGGNMLTDVNVTNKSHEMQITSIKSVKIVVFE